MPRDDFVAPATERAPERTDLDRPRGVGHVADQLVDELGRGLVVSERVELSDGLLGVPGGRHVTVRVSGAQQSRELLLTALVEALGGLDEESPGPKERVVLAASVTQQLVLDASAALVELVDGVLHDVEGIGDEARLGQGDLESAAVGAGEVEGARLDVEAPQARAPEQPASRRLGRSALDHVEEPSATHVDDRGRELATVEGSPAHEAGLIQTEGTHPLEAGSIQGEQPPADAHERVVDGVPVAPELGRHLVDGATEPTDLQRRPTSRPRQHRVTRQSDPAVLLGEARLRAHPVRAAEPSLAPDHPGAPTPIGQIHQCQVATVLQVHGCRARRTPGRGRRLLDGDRQAHAVIDSIKDTDVGQAHQDVAKGSIVKRHEGSPF